MSYKIMLDAGHGGTDSGASGNGLVEKNINLLIVNEIIKQASEIKEITIIPTRTTDKAISLDERIRLEKSNSVDCFISVHCNASNGAGFGTETYFHSSDSKGRSLATYINNEVHAVVNRRDRGVKPGDSYAVINGTKSTAVLTEIAFIDNKEDSVVLSTKVTQVAKAIINAIKLYFKIKDKVEEVVPTPTPSTKTPIMQDSKATVEQMKSFLLKCNPTPKINCSVEDLCKHFLEEGEIEGIAGDIAFCQAIKETGYFKFGGDVLPEQNNYCGLGTTGNGVKGAYFESPQIGVRAQIQHLKAYASKDGLSMPCVDPRYSLVSKGSADTWEGLNGKWAIPGNGYGEDILSLHAKMLKENTTIVVPESKQFQIVIDVNSEEEANSIVEILKKVKIQVR